MTRPSAILLVGPTGSGKTPLGEEIESRGLGGRCCSHFDFGAQLRAAVEGNPPPGLSARDIEFLRRVLDRGALLEDEHFPIADTILRAFLTAHPEDRVILNGLPRHVGQAEDVDRFVHVEVVVALQCSAQVVLERIRTDAGGDRADRVDDDPDAVRRKLAIYTERTAPLVEHYRARGSRILSIPIAADTTAESAYQTLAATCTWAAYIL
jgi:adenylate kinase family enzyme